MAKPCRYAELCLNPKASGGHCGEAVARRWDLIHGREGSWARDNAALEASLDDSLRPVDGHCPPDPLEAVCAAGG